MVKYNTFLVAIFSIFFFNLKSYLGIWRLTFIIDQMTFTDKMAKTYTYHSTELLRFIKIIFVCKMRSSLIGLHVTRMVLTIEDWGKIERRKGNNSGKAIKGELSGRNYIHLLYKDTPFIVLGIPLTHDIFQVRLIEDYFFIIKTLPF